MKDTLYLKLDNEQAWLTPAADVSGETLIGVYYQDGEGGELFRGDLSSLKDWLDASRRDLFDLDIKLVLGGVNLVLQQVNIPSKQSRHIAQALPYMLEDLVADDLDSLQVATGSRHKNGDMTVLLCQRELLERVNELFAAEGLSLKAVLADMQCLHAEPNQWQFFTDGRTLLLRQDEQRAMAIELDALPVLLHALLQEDQPKPEAIEVMISRDKMSTGLESWLKTQFTSHLADQVMGFNIDYTDLNGFHYLTQQCQQKQPQAVNLLQGDFKPAGQKRKTLFNWKPVAALAAVFVLVLVGVNYLQAWRMNSLADDYTRQAEAIYKRYFPNSRRITDLKRQMRGKIRAVEMNQAGEGFLGLLARVGEQVNQLNRGKGQPRLNPMRVSFDQVKGDLNIDFIANAFADLDELKSSLQAMSLKVEIARASQDGDKTKARMKIRSAG